MIELPDSTTFVAALSERRFALAVAVSGLSGLVRGFSGFGGAMIYMPLIAALYEPRIAAATLLQVDFLSSTPFAIPQVRHCNWREVAPLSVAMAVGVPVGAWILVGLDPIALRWGIALLVLSMLPVLLSGWRYHGPATLPITFGVGSLAGVCAGAAQIAGPPVILYWLSRGNNAALLRANLMVFFLFCGITLILVYGAQGLFNAHTIALALMLAIPYVAGVAIGSRFFRASSERLYRMVAYAIVALAALVSLPAFDSILR